MVVGMNGSLRQHILKESRLPFFFARNALISDDFGLVHIVSKTPSKDRFPSSLGGAFFVFGRYLLLVIVRFQV